MQVRLLHGAPRRPRPGEIRTVEGQGPDRDTGQQRGLDARGQSSDVCRRREAALRERAGSDSQRSRWGRARVSAVPAHVVTGREVPGRGEGTMIRDLVHAAVAGMAWGVLYLALIIMILTAQDGIMDHF